MSTKTLEQAIHDIRFKPKERVEIFKALPSAMQARVCLLVSKHLAYDLLVHLPNQQIATVLEHLDPDETTDVIQLFPKRTQHKFLEQFNSEIRQSVELLIQFDPNTAAGLMNLDYIQVDETDSITAVAKQFRVHEKRTGRLPAILVLKKSGLLSGYMPGHALGIAKPREKARKHVRHIATIMNTASHEEVIDLFRTHPHNKMVVLGNRKQVLGIIYSDDVLRILHERESSSLYDFAGVSDEESVLDSAFKKVKFRYQWLIINLGTGFLAAFVVSLFDATIAKYVLLAIYMPIVAGMGGNAATQTLAIMVRGISLKQVNFVTVWRTLQNEVLAGIINGLINGAIVAFVVLVFNHDSRLALVLGLAMVINLVVAAVFGTMIPLIMQRIGKDPASSATVFITTATDVLGFLAFLGLASVWLH